MRNAFIFYINKKVDMSNDIRHGKKNYIRHQTLLVPNFLHILQYQSFKARILDLSPRGIRRWNQRVRTRKTRNYHPHSIPIAHTHYLFLYSSLSAFLRCTLSISLPVTHLSSFSSSICHVMHSMCSNHKISLDLRLMDITMDGPYGRFVSYSDHKIVVLVAGIQIENTWIYLILILSN